MIYIDANIFVLCQFDATAKGTSARALMQGIVDGKLAPAITSALTLDEVMWAVMKNKMQGELRNVITSAYTIPNLTIKEVGPNIPLAALNLIEEHGLKPRDAFHAAIMKSFGITEIASDDADFDKVKWIKRIKL